MKKLRGMLALLLCTALVAAMMVAPSSAAVLYFTSLNDSLEQLSTETMPLWSGGTLYVPLSLFSPSSNTTGVDLGLNISYSATSNTATLFNLRKMLVFDLNKGTCYSDLTGETFSGRAISRNGRVYVPVGRVCEFFGFSWSYNSIPTVEDGYLVRVKNDGVVLDDNKFLDAAAELIGRRLRDYNQRMNPDPVTPDPATKPSDDVEEEEPASTVYLGFRCGSGEEMTAVLDLLEGKGKTGVFLLTAEQIRTWDDQVRRAAGMGHLIALTGNGETAQDTAEQLRQGQRALEDVCCQRSAVAYAPKDQREQLEQSGWVCWQETLAAQTKENQGAAAFSKSVVRSLGTRRRTAYLTIEGEKVSQVLSALLRQLEDKNYVVAVPLETRL